MEIQNILNWFSSLLEKPTDLTQYAEIASLLEYFFCGILVITVVSFIFKIILAIFKR